ncbi:hypothetical protein D083_0407 [Dickeya solani RNS 08.23.3.1.A]|nr:hypothetical protein D083_0407 [Dickeya solani RNS 08.23.3.1.A]
MFCHYRHAVMTKQSGQGYASTSHADKTNTLGDDQGDGRY